MKKKSLLLSVIVLLFISGCSKEKEEVKPEEVKPDVTKNTQNTPMKTFHAKDAAKSKPYAHKVLVEEVLQANSYTYLRVMEGKKEDWLAIPKGEFKKGQTLYYEMGMEMPNFESKDLKRTFPSVFFLQDISTEPTMQVKEPPKLTPKKHIPTKLSIKIEPAKNGISIAELFAKKASYSGKTVIIKGKVTKTSENILGKNWIHVQDGTSDGDNFDLTITTTEMPKTDDIVTFEGKVSLNKDYGYGYSYSVIIEDAKIKKDEKVI